jgi:hypothetical protein
MYNVQMLGGNTRGLFNRGNKNLVAARVSGFGRFGNRLYHLVQLLFSYYQFDFDIGQEVHGVFFAAIDFRVAFVAPEAFDFGGRHLLDPCFTQGIFDFLKSERFDEGFDFFHGFFTASFNRSTAWALTELSRNLLATLMPAGEVPGTDPNKAWIYAGFGGNQNSMR